MTLTKLKKELRKMDPQLNFNDESGIGALFLMASAIHGPRIRIISKFLQLPESHLRQLKDRAIANGIWQGRKIHSAWFEEDGAIAFWCDVNVVLGLMRRS